jgi:hypothetical protein
MLVARKNNSYHKNNSLQWTIKKSSVQRVKFDLVNIMGGKLTILELKNRVDSGGTAAREKALRKKFFTISRTIENEEKIFVYNNKEYDFVAIFSLLGINELDMSLGLLYDVNGKEATISSDRSNGFYSSSKTHMKNYVNEQHPISEVNLDENILSLSFKKGSLNVTINMLYGAEIIQRFTSKQYDIRIIMEKVFSTVWDDIWLVVNLAISQRAILLKYKKDHMIQLKNLKENDEYFNLTFTKFCQNPRDLKTLTDLVYNIRKQRDFLDLPLTSEHDGYLADCLYAFTSYIMSKTYLIKKRKKGSGLGLKQGVILEK